MIWVVFLFVFPNKFKNSIKLLYTYLPAIIRYYLFVRYVISFQFLECVVGIQRSLQMHSGMIILLSDHNVEVRSSNQTSKNRKFYLTYLKYK